MPPPPSTPKGIGWMVRALMIYPVSLVLGAVAGVVALAVLADFQANPNPFLNAGPFLGVVVLGAAAGILGFVVLVFYLVGFGYTYKGRNELGPAHARNVRISLYMLIVAIVLAGASGGTTAFLFLLAFRFDFFAQTTVFDPSMFYLAHIVSIAFGIVVAACVASHLVLTIRALAKPEHERFLYAAAAIGTATPGVAGAITLLLLPRFIATIVDRGTNFPPVGAETGFPSLVSAILTLVTVLLFLMAFRGAEGRLRSSELRPTVPPLPPTPSWMPGPMVPYPPYGAYVPPVPAPPPAPPAQPPPTPPPP